MTGTLGLAEWEINDLTSQREAREHEFRLGDVSRRAAQDVIADALMLPLLFHNGDPVSDATRAEWKRITGTDQMTTRVMCHHIRLVLLARSKP